MLDLLRWSSREFQEAGDHVHTLAVPQTFRWSWPRPGRTDEASSLRHTVHVQGLPHTIQVRAPTEASAPGTWNTAVETSSDPVSWPGLSPWLPEVPAGRRTSFQQIRVAAETPR